MTTQPIGEDAAEGSSAGLIITVVIAVAFAVLGAAVLIIGGPIFALLMMSGNTGTSSNSERDRGCDTVNELKVLSTHQTDTARQIYLAAIKITTNQDWPENDRHQAAVIALATAMQESSLGTAPGWDRPNNDGDAGLFQQRTLPGWYGTPDEVSDPAQATAWFLLGRTLTTADITHARRNGTTPAGPAGYTIPGLAQIDDWQTLPLTEAAQAVQRSATPDAYAAHEPLARALAATFDTTGSGSCGPPGDSTCTPSDSAQQLLRNQGPRLTPDAHRTLACVSAQFRQITSWAGIGDRPSNVDRDHQEGRALDAMIPGWDTPQGHQLGQQIADWIVTNHQQLGVKYVIFDARIWSTTRPEQGWLECGHGGSCYSGPDPTQAHRDHVHISVHGNTATTNPPGTVVLPVTKFVLTGRFGQCGTMWQNCHTGLDFAAPLGTPVHAVADGTVISAGPALLATGSSAYGNLIQIDHGDYRSWYAHLHQTDVTPGEHVTAGQTIGAVGTTGNSSGPHLHLEIRPAPDGIPINPYTWLTSHGLEL